MKNEIVRRIRQNMIKFFIFGYRIVYNSLLTCAGSGLGDGSWCAPPPPWSGRPPGYQLRGRPWMRPFHHFVIFFQNDLSIIVDIADVIHGPPLTGSWYLTTAGWSSHGSGPARIWSWHWNDYFFERSIISFWSVSHSQTHYWEGLTNIESFCYCWTNTG